MNRIRELRIARHMKQKELAEILNVAQNSISNYEKEVRALDPGLINRLCEIFDCSADYLLCRSNRKKEKPAGQPDELTLDVSDLTPENRQRVEDYLRLLLMTQQTPPLGGDSPGKADGTDR